MREENYRADGKLDSSSARISISDLSSLGLHPQNVSNNERVGCFLSLAWGGSCAY
jgi:hypothetical protein